MEIKHTAHRNTGYLRYALILALTVLVMLVCAAPSHAVLNVTPGSVQVLKGKSTTVMLTWNLTGVGNDSWDSPQGLFETPVGSLGTNAIPLAIVTVGGTGSITESLVIPDRVVDTAAQGGNTSFTYRREFRNSAGAPGGADSLSITITFPSQAAGPVSLRRVELYYEEDGRRTNEVSVARNTRGLSALADLYVNGTGYLEGYWEVDGRRLENVRKYASFGSKLTVRTSDVPGMPTFRPGLHSVRLVITSPAPGFALPRIGYIVTSETAKAIRQLHVQAPEGGAELNAETAFSWRQGPEAAFVLTFTEQLKGEVVLTAQTKDSSYTLPARLLSDRFSPGASYLWQVNGYGADGELLSESRPRKITVGQ